MEATRQLYWNTHGKGLMYLFALIAFVIFIVGFTQKVRRWQKGQPIICDNIGLRFKMFLSAIIKHDKGIYRGTFRRFAHLGIFYGFFMLTIGTLLIAIQVHFGIPIFFGKKYLILSLLLDLFGLMSMIGIVMAAYKRYIDKSDHKDYTLDDAILLILVFSILFTGFVLEGFRIYSTDDPWASWSPVGLFFSVITKISGLSVLSAHYAHAFLWYFHMLLTFGFIAYIPYSKLFHMFASPVNIFLRSFSPIGTLTPVDILSKDIRDSGVMQLENFSKKQLVELDACISCGRCQKGCPANMSGAPLSPRIIIQSLKGHSIAKNADRIIDRVISKEMLWSCTTCGLCEDKCPIYLEHIKRIVDMRRTMVTVDYPTKVQKVFKNISDYGNPWGQSIDSKFFEINPQVPLLSEKKQTEILYWVGCFGSYKSRTQKVSQAMLKIFEKAKIDYALLGTEEKCCGDSVRRIGNEKLFQHLAFENVRTLNHYKFNTIVTQCPHCYNTLKRDYPQFGGHYQVMHHSEFILDLIKSGKINLKGANSSKVTFHDPCYLGRYNSIYNAPRDVLTSIPGIELVEMKNNRARAFCCGAGGGRIWIEKKEAQTISSLLLKKALRTDADILASACSLCLATLTEGVSSLDSDIRCLDIAEIVYSAL